MSKTPARRFAINALLLIIVNLIMRSVGVAFNVYLSNRAGGEVMGLFSLIGGVYAFAMTLGCGGINLGTTRLVADTMGLYGESSAAAEREISRCLRRCLVYSLCFGVAAGALLFLLAPTVGSVWLGDSRTVTSLKVLSLTLLPIALSSCLSGYFTALRHVAPNAAVGILTQLIRVGACAYLLTLWLGDGVEATCLALVLGGAVSEIGGMAFSYAAYRLSRRARTKKSIVNTSDISAQASLSKKLLGITLPVTLSACLRSGLITLQHILIPKGLKASGANWSEALSSYGVVHSMVLPVVLFPSAFISSFSGLLVPEIAQSHAAKDLSRVARISERIIRPALIFSFGVAGIMSCFSHELGMLLYNSSEAGMYIRRLAPLIPIMYVDSSVDGVLKGMGEQVYSMNVNIADALSSVLLVWLLLPRMGLSGYILTIYVTETLNTTLSLTRMLRVSGMRVNLREYVFGPLLAVVGATVLIRLMGLWLPLPNAETTLGLTFLIILTSLIYLLLCLMTGVIGRKEISELRTLIPQRSPKTKGGSPPFRG